MKKYFSTIIILLSSLLFSCGDFGDNKDPEPMNGLFFEINQTQILNSINFFRANGCRCGSTQMPKVPILKWEKKLETSANNHTMYMKNNNSFSFIGANNSNTTQRMAVVGYNNNGVSEAIGRGYDNIQDAIDNFIKNESICKSIMNSLRSDIGLSRYAEYWMLVVGTPK